MIKGDKIKLTKQMGAFINTGEICEVVNITQDGVISFRFGKNREHLGCMSYDEFEKYFELVDKEKKSQDKRWTEWECRVVRLLHLNGIRKEHVVFFRTNGKKVQIKHIVGEDNVIKAESSCMDTDKFKLAKGFDLAKDRLNIKLMKFELENAAKYV